MTWIVNNNNFLPLVHFVIDLCSTPLSKDIPDAALSASSYYVNLVGPHQARYVVCIFLKNFFSVLLSLRQVCNPKIISKWFLRDKFSPNKSISFIRPTAVYYSPWNLPSFSLSLRFTCLKLLQPGQRRQWNRICICINDILNGGKSLPCESREFYDKVVKFSDDDPYFHMTFLTFAHIYYPTAFPFRAEISTLGGVVLCGADTYHAYEPDVV